MPMPRVPPPSHAARRRAGYALCTGVGVALCAGVAAAMATSPLRAQPTPAAEINFDIPAQPIASALEAYSSATRLELFYDGALATGRSSQAVNGRLTPDAALLALLAGTGLVARVTGRTSLSLVQSVPSRGPNAADQSYFAVVQKRLAPVLCERAETRPGASDRLLRIWITASGTVARAQLVDLVDSASVTDAAALHGLMLGAPPADMPQPVTLAILARGTGGRSGCEAR